MSRDEFLQLLTDALNAAGAQVGRYESAPNVEDLAVERDGARYRLRVTRTAPRR
ncbi:MAG: hypothetical protein KDB70_04080 [Mycobacterium sp.]|nr:hypothetical protein [Mycobacterium sp.]